MGSEQTKCQAMPKEIDDQIGGTCYAHASKLVFIEALKRKEQQVPPAEDILEAIIDKFGKNGGHAHVALEWLIENYSTVPMKVRCYSLKSAAEIVNPDRPMCLSFWLKDNQMTFFCEYFRKNPNKILTSQELPASLLEQHQEKSKETKEKQDEAYYEHPENFPEDYVPGLFTGLIEKIGSLYYKWTEKIQGHGVVI